jgi:hypothetical protein
MKIYRNYIVAILPILCFYLLCCWDGNLRSPDSESYLQYAKNLLISGKLLNDSGEALIYWPPLFIYILIPAVKFPIYTVLLNLSLLIYHQFIWIKIGARYLKESKSLFFFSVLLGLNTLILMVAVYIWSELLFMALLGTTVFALLQFKEKSEYRYLIAFSASLGAALLTRNAGVFLLPGFFVTGFLIFQNKKKWHFWMALGTAVSGNFIWNMNQIFILNHQSVMRELLPDSSLLNNTVLTLSEIGYNFWPRLVLDWVSAGLIFSGLIVIISKVKWHGEGLPLWILLPYILIWFIIPAHPDDIGRLLAPMSPFLLILIYQQISDFLKKPPLKLIFYSISYYLIVISLLRIISNTITWSNIN